MKTLILQGQNNNTMDLVLQLIKELKIKARFLTDEEIEDSYMANLIDKGMKEKGEVSLTELRKKIRK